MNSGCIFKFKAKEFAVGLSMGVDIIHMVIFW